MSLNEVYLNGYQNINNGRDLHDFLVTSKIPSGCRLPGPRSHKIGTMILCLDSENEIAGVTLQLHGG